MSMSDRQLCERISPELAVDRALTPAERLIFRRHALVGQYEGAAPADWIADQVDRDAHLGKVTAWMCEHGNRATAALMHHHGLPKLLVIKLLSRAVYATIAMPPTGVSPWPRSPWEIASHAALWARGYAERSGWTPPETRTLEYTGPSDLPDLAQGDQTAAAEALGLAVEAEVGSAAVHGRDPSPQGVHQQLLARGYELVPAGTTDELAELNSLFQLQWTRMQEATMRWRSQDPEARALQTPDLGRLLRWLMDQADRPGGADVSPGDTQQQKP